MFFSFPDKIIDFDDRYCFIDWSLCYIPDIKEYAHNINNLNIEYLINNINKINGGISLHSFFYFFSNENNILYISFIINSLIISFIFIAIYNSYGFKLKKLFFIYIFLLPFFMLYSLGPTKEIIIFLGLFIFINFSKLWQIVFAIFLIIFSRSSMLPVVLITKYLKFNVKLLFPALILISIVLPWVYLDLGFIFSNYDLSRFSQYIESLKYNSYFFSIFGILSAILKNLLEPYIYLFKTNFDLTNLVITVNLIYFSKFYFDIYRYKKVYSLFSTIEFKLFSLSLLLLSTYPLIQSRYLLLPVILMILKVMKLKLDNNSILFIK